MLHPGTVVECGWRVGLPVGSTADFKSDSWQALFDCDVVLTLSLYLKQALFRYDLFLHFVSKTSIVRL